jgi:hypothetical protein
MARRLCDRCGRWYGTKLAHDGLGEVCRSCRPASGPSAPSVLSRGGSGSANLQPFRYVTLGVMRKRNMPR